jgi:hypothetical protein
MNANRILPSFLAVSVMGMGCAADEEKMACNAPGDCLDGWVCVDRLCVDRDASERPDASDEIGPGNPPPDAASMEHGAVEPLAVATWGLAAGPSYQSYASVSSAPGNLGCALTVSTMASPGTQASVALVSVDASTGDGRCPEGVHTVIDDAETCGHGLEGFELGDGCGLYKRWDASGTEVALRFAQGGYVNVARTDLDTDRVSCSVDLQLAFPGGVTVTRSYTYEFDPYGVEDSFCGH